MSLDITVGKQLINNTCTDNNRIKKIRILILLEKLSFINNEDGGIFFTECEP